MIVTASTVKDSPENLRTFVARNLAGGVDHLVVFVDDGDTDVLAALGEEPHVTAVAARWDWWQGKRPVQLNARQRINANVLKVLLTVLEDVDWVFHVDADEVLLVDDDALAAVPADVEVVRALPYEAVSRRRWPRDTVTHFKPILGPEALDDLHRRGLVAEPTNGYWFHGHVDGKVGLRPAVDRWLTLHHVRDVRERLVRSGDMEAVRLLHYESWSGEEFVRKWTKLLTSGGKLSFRPAREPVAEALREVIKADLSPRRARSRLMRIYRETTEDDFAALRDLGVLVEADPMKHGHEPRPLGDTRAAELATLLAAVWPENKWPFHTGRTARDLDALLGRVADRVAETDPALAERARRAWAFDPSVLAAAAGNRKERADDGSGEGEPVAVDPDEERVVE